MLKVAVPVRGEYLSENFTQCSYYLIYEIKNKKIVGKKVEVFTKGFQGMISDWPKKLGITDVIAHGIDKASLSEISDTKINLFVGVSISTPDKLIEEYLNGTLRSDTHSITEKGRIK